MRALAITVVVLAVLAGCIHLPAEVAGVVTQSDPAGSNHYIKRSAPDPATAHDQIPAR